MSDFINREKALEAIANLTCFGIEEIKAQCNTSVSDSEDDWLSGIRDAVIELESLPTVELEQKKGHWVKVGGYFTPGGDPVWKCSECGKGMHVYGIEEISYNRNYTDGHQWVACPNCGADMRNEI